MGDENPIHTFGDFSRPSHEGYQNTIELPDGNNVVPLRSDTIRLVQNGCSFHGLRSEYPNQHLNDFLKLIDSLDLDVNLSLKHGLVSKTYFKKSLIMALIFGSKSKSFMTISIPLQGEPSINWPVNDPRDFAKPVKAISLLQNVLSTSDCRLIKLENQVHHLMEAHLAPKSPVQVNKIASSNFTYVVDFMIVEDISSIIDPRLSQVVLGKPFVKISNMTRDLSLGIVKFANRTDEIAYKMPHKIDQFNSLSDLEKKHTKSIYVRNEEDKRRGVDYVMNKILGFYKECLELGPEYLTGLE
ncbi:hypothetical protein Tco_1262317 [Tanacetum coccineum]